LEGNLSSNKQGTAVALPGSSITFTKTTSTSAVVVDSEEEYKVVVIHGKKRSRNQDLYLVEWVGYPNKVDWTWEPRRNLTNMKEVLKAFEEWSNNKSSR